MAAAAGAFILYPFAPYYVIHLAAQRLRTLIRQQKANVEALQQALIAAGRAVPPVDDISAISAARSALTDLSLAADSRTTAVKNIDKIPAYQRFKTQTQQFLEGPSKSLRYGQLLLPSPAAAKKDMPALLAKIQTTQARITKQVTQLINAYAEYSALSLPSRVTQAVVAQSKAVLTKHEDTLKGQTPHARLDSLKEVTLDVIAARAAIQALGSFNPVGDRIAFEGTATPYWDAERPAIAAEWVMDLPSPYALQPLDELEVTTNDGTETILLPSSFVPFFRSSLGEPFTIDISDPTFVFTFSVTRGGVTTAGSIDLTAMFGVGTFDTEYVAAALSVPLAAYGLQVTPVFTQIKVSSITSLLDDGSWDGATQYWTITVPGTNFTTLNVAVGDYLTFFAAETTGLDAFLTNPYWQVEEVAPGGDTTKLRIKRAMAVAMSVPSITPHSLRFSLGLPRFLRLEPTDSAQAVSDALTISIAGAPNTGASFLGFTPGITSRVTYLSAKTIADDITLKSRFCRADTVTHTVGETYVGYATVTNPQIIQFSRVARALVSFTQSTGFFYATALTTDFEAAGVVPGDYLTVRTGSNTGRSYLITAVAGKKLTATGTLSYTDSASIDVAPDMSSLLGANSMAVISDGPNKGQYQVKSAGTVPTELKVASPLPQYKASTSLISFSVSLGTVHIRVRALDATTNCTIKLGGSGSPRLDSRLPATEATRGTVSWYSLSSVPKLLSEGDKLGIYATTYNNPTESYVLTELYKDKKIFRINGARPNNLSIAFADTPPPYAVFMPGQYIEYSVFTAALAAWLARPENTGNYFTNLQGYVNKVVQSSSPTAVDIGTAQSALLTLYVGLDAQAAATEELPGETTLDVVLRSFRVQEQVPVTSLLRACRERGATRALDTLLEARFADFFAIQGEEASYAGAVQQAIKDVARNDMPVRKVGRGTAEREIATITGTDPDYDVQDTEEPSLIPAGEGDFSEMPAFYTKE